MRQSHLDVAETHTKEHGRLVTRRLQVSTRLAGHDHWPGLQQVCCLQRSTRHRGQHTVEIQYAITSLPRSRGKAANLIDYWRGHWGIENRSHYVRDVTLHEDGSRIRSGHAPQNLATLRNALISLLRFQGHANIASALRAYTWQIQRLLATLGIMKK